MKKNVEARSLEEVVLEWTRHLQRMNEDLTGLEQAIHCVDNLLAALNAKQSKFMLSFVAGLFFHWSAIGARRLHKRGNRKYPNVALQRLQDQFGERPDVILASRHRQSLAAWIGPDATSPPRLDDVITSIKRDRERLDEAMRVVGDYADTIAHLQLVDEGGLGETRIKGKQIREAIETLRRQLNWYSLLLTGDAPPSLNKELFTAGFDEEVKRFISESD